MWPLRVEFELELRPDSKGPSAMVLPFSLPAPLMLFTFLNLANVEAETQSSE